MADKYTNIAALTEFLAKVKEWANGRFALSTQIPTKVSQLTNDSGYTTNTGTITGITMNGASKGTSGVVNLGTVITAHQDISGKANTADLADVATSGSYNDLTNKPTIPAAVTESTVSGWGFTKNAGTVTGIKMNGSSKGSSGVVDLGTVLTAHQDISGKQDKITAITAQSTQAVYPIKIDSQGHITAYGSAVTVPPATAAAGKVYAGPASGDAAAPSFKSLATTSIGSASAGTAISADDITAWTTNTPTSVTKKTVVTSATFNTVVTSASGASASYSNGVLTITNGSFGTGASGSATTGDSVSVTAGTAASLSYTSRSIPNISVTSKTVATGGLGS